MSALVPYHVSASEICNWCYTFIKVSCVPFPFINRSCLPTVIAVSAPCKRPANALQRPKDSVGASWDRGDRRGSSVWSPWGRNGINDIRCRRSANAVDAPWGRGRDTVTSPYTPWGLRANATVYSGVLAAIICVPVACTRCPRGALHCYCAAAANTQRSHGAHSDRRGNAEPRRALCACTKGAPWHGVLGDLTASSGDVTAIPRRSRSFSPREPHALAWGPSSSHTKTCVIRIGIC